LLHRHGTFTAITVQRLEWATFVNIVTSPVRRRDLGGPDGSVLIVSDAPAAVTAGGLAALVDAVALVPAVVALDGDAEADAAAAPVADVIATGPGLDAIVERVGACPLAATAFVTLLRGSGPRSIADGLAAESAVYAALQAGPEFLRWRDAHPARNRLTPDRPAVTMARAGDELTITVDRPEVRNALDAAMRDELWNAFLVAAGDPDLRVTWRAAGPDFGSGGHLDEFGSRPDPATAHVVRLTRSLGALVAELAGRITAELHGACMGSGIELPAFAGTVRAAPDTRIGLPELAMGLIPGAGGTVSLPHRIGRHRTAWLGLTGQTIDAPTARRWGLVDELSPD
jgi:enoyl-CoA hydratase/carnithine racemase